MPDKEIRKKQDETNSLLKQFLKAQNIDVVEHNSEEDADIKEYLPEL